MRAAFSFELPSLRRSSYIFSFLIDEFGMVKTFCPDEFSFEENARGHTR